MEGSDSDAELRRYYAARASEYERIYHKPERQADLRRLESRVPDLLAGRRVLEIACGTGYWTRFVSTRADAVVAIDASEQTLAIARAGAPASPPVDWRLADAYDLPDDLGSFDGVFAGFWWSHVPLGEQRRFLRSLARRLSPSARVVLLDNLYVEGSSTPIALRDSEGNCYQRRRLDDGSEYMVLKNFPAERELRATIAPYARQLSYERLDYYWTLVWEWREPG